MVRDYAHNKLCPVLAALDIYMGSIELGQPDDLPMVASLDKDGNLQYLTYSKIASMIRSAARHVHADMTGEEIKKFSSHSYRVFACVLLHEAGSHPDTIKNRLHWMGESYRLYLRDTAEIQKKHNKALDASSEQLDVLLAAVMMQPPITHMPELDPSLMNYEDCD